MGIMGLVWMILVGFIVGVLARFVYPGAVPLGFWLTALLGIGGSIVGGLIGQMFGGSKSGSFTPAGWLMSLVGSVILIWAWTTFAR